MRCLNSCNFNDLFLKKKTRTSIQSQTVNKGSLGDRNIETPQALGSLDLKNTPKE